MNMHRLAGIVIVVGFVIYWIGNLYSPPNVYQETDLDLRLQIVDDYPARFAVSQGLAGVGMAVIVAGLFLVSIRSPGDATPWLTYLPAALILVSVALLAIWLYQYISDPASIWGSDAQSQWMLGAQVLMMIGALLYGFLFLQIGLPAWLSYLNIGYAAVALVAILIAQPPAFAVISIYHLVLLPAAIALIMS